MKLLNILKMKEYGSDFKFKINIFPKEKINFKNKKFYFLGRIAIKKIIKDLNLKKTLIPNYLCDSIFNCFDNYDYYNIDNQFQINEQYLINKVKDKFDSIYIINYFGITDKRINKLINILKSKNITIIEDFTHNPYTNYNFGDISICSYRKSLESPFGCYVIDKNSLLSPQTIYFDFMYIYANLLKCIGMLLKYIYILKFIWRPILLKCEKIIDNIDYNGLDYINLFFYKRLFNKKNYQDSINNFKILDRTICKHLNKPKNISCFSYYLIFENNQIRNKIRTKLIKNSIYCPIHWPQNFEALNLCNTFISDRILSIPIDHRYNELDMIYIGNTINSIYMEENN